jgi:uncharacterized protein
MPRLDLGRLYLQGRHLQQLQDLLAAHLPTAEVWAYGSRVTGGAHEGSDLDLVVRDPVDALRVVPGVDQLRDALQQSTLPMLVELHQWAHLPEAFRQEVGRAYVVLAGGRLA